MSNNKIKLLLLAVVLPLCSCTSAAKKAQQRQEAQAAGQRESIMEMLPSSNSEPMFPMQPYGYNTEVQIGMGSTFRDH